LMGTDGTPGVIVAGRGVAVAVTTTGVETLNAREISAVESAW